MNEDYVSAQAYDQLYEEHETSLEDNKNLRKEFHDLEKKNARLLAALEFAKDLLIEEGWKDW